MATIRAMRALEQMRLNAERIEDRRERERSKHRPVPERLMLVMFVTMFSAFWCFLFALVLGLIP